MRLNNDCIRDILLYIEENTDFEHPRVMINVITDYFKDKYDINTLNYHIKMIAQANLVDRVAFADNGPVYITNLSWDGHQYLDNIRSDKVWKAVKKQADSLGSISLKLLIPLAESYIKHQLGLS